MYIIEGSNVAGAKVVYTGCAGPRWVSDKREDAFTYHEKPLYKVTQFNAMTSIHGYTFTVQEE